MKVPNLFIIGAPKSGTTSVAYGLSAHPEIYMPKSKEPRYFDAHVYYDNPEDYPFKSVEEYLRLYCDCGPENRYLIDASVLNMYSKESIDRILELSPDAKFLIMLRDP